MSFEISKNGYVFLFFFETDLITLDSVRSDQTQTGINLLNDNLKKKMQSLQTITIILILYLLIAAFKISHRWLRNRTKYDGSLLYFRLAYSYYWSLEPVYE